MIGEFESGRSVCPRSRGTVAGCSWVNQPKDCGLSDQKSGQSPCRQTTTHSLRVADISSRCVRRAPGDRRRVRSGGLLAATASSLVIQRARQESVIKARPQSDRWPFPKVSEDYRFADGSRWQGIRECMATVSPMAHPPQPIQPSGRRRCHATENLPDVRKPEDCYPQRSCAPSFIAHVEDLVPGFPREVRLQPVPLESCLPESETAAALSLRKGPTEALFDNGFYGSLLSLCQLPYFFVKVIWYLYGCFHMANPIILYGKMSSNSRGLI